MTAHQIVRPLNVVDCDGRNGNCGVRYTPTNPFNQLTQDGARHEARAAGWTVRPNRGPGAKSAPDLCPTCTVTAREGAA